MSTTAVPSKLPEDFALNIENLDKFTNSTSSTFTDRLGGVKKTMAGVLSEYPNASSNAAAAAASAGASEASRLASGVSAGLATAAKVAAEAARDAAMVTGKVYATTAAGLAAVASGAYFSVPSADNNESLILYLNNAGAAVEQKRYPSSAAAAPFLSSFPPGYSLAVTDEQGLSPGGWKEDGTFAAHTIEVKYIAPENLLIGPDLVTSYIPSGFVGGCVTDEQGLSPGGWKTDGTWAVQALEASTINGQSTATLPDYRLKGTYATEIAHIISYGQSLSIGNGGFFLQTDTQPFDSLMFSAGVRVQEGAGSAAVNHAAFIPLVSAVNGTSGNGETPAGNTAAMVKRLILKENTLAYTDHNYQILVSAPGQSNTAIAGLIKGQTPYNNLMADVTYGYANSQAIGKSYSVPTITWSQGEADYNLGKTYAEHLAALLQLYTDLNADIKAITNQSADLKLIAYQCNDVTTTSPATIGLAQLQASKTNANILIACPSYCLPHLNAGNAHLTGPGYGQLGAYFGLVHKRVVVDGGVWKPLMPTATQRQGAIVTAQFSVPVLPLVLDSTLLPAVAMSGFTLVDNVGASITINSVALTGPATVKIVAATTIPKGSKLRYGYLAGGGNLRDSQGLIFDAGVKALIPLHNWCVAFEETLA